MQHPTPTAHLGRLVDVPVNGRSECFCSANAYEGIAILQSPSDFSPAGPCVSRTVQRGNHERQGRHAIGRPCLTEAAEDDDAAQAADCSQDDQSLLTKTSRSFHPVNACTTRSQHAWQCICVSPVASPPGSLADLAAAYQHPPVARVHDARPRSGVEFRGGDEPVSPL